MAPWPPLLLLKRPESELVNVREDEEDDEDNYPPTLLACFLEQPSCMEKQASHLTRAWL